MLKAGLFLYLLHICQAVFLPDWFVFDLRWGLTGFGPSGFTAWLRVALRIRCAVGFGTPGTSSVTSLLALRLTPRLRSRAVRFLWCWIAITLKMCMLRNNENIVALNSKIGITFTSLLLNLSYCQKCHSALMNCQ